MSNNINLDYAKKASDETSKFYSTGLTYAVYGVSISIPIFSVLVWFLISSEHINLKFIGLENNYALVDFLIYGFVIGYFFFFILATVDMVQKMRRKIELDTLLKKNALDLSLIEKMKTIFWVVGAFSILSILVLIFGIIGSVFEILLFKPYERKIAPPGVGPGIAEAHEFSYT